MALASIGVHVGLAALWPSADLLTASYVELEPIVSENEQV